MNQDCDTCKRQVFPNPNRPEFFCAVKGCRVYNKEEESIYYSLYEADEDKVDERKDLWLQKQFEKKGW